MLLSQLVLATHPHIESLYRDYGPMVLRRARRILGDEQAARDAMQEVFVRALRAGRTFRGDASPMTWLYRITTNYCINLLRDSTRRSALLAAQGPPSDRVDGVVEDRVVIASVLDKLPLALQEIAIYHYVDQMSQDEIAEVLGVSRRTVGNRLQEFRQAAAAEQRALARAAEVR